MFMKKATKWAMGIIAFAILILVAIWGSMKMVQLEKEQEQAQKKLHRSRQCITRIFRELEYSGLICRKKQGLGKPALITLNYPSNAKLIRPKEVGENLSG